MNKKLEELVKDFKSYDKLRDKLWNLCNEYAKKNVLPQEFKEYKFDYHEFQDFMLVNNYMVALFFLDEYGDHCRTFHTITIEDLLEFLN